MAEESSGKELMESGLLFQRGKMRLQVEEIFHEVADLSADARVRYFEKCGVDELMRAEVEALVAFDDSDLGISLDGEVGQIAQGALDQFDRLDANDSRCGSYRLGNLLGRGGMGAVYLAERVDGEVCQRVAVKLLRPGTEDAHLRERFLAERQILATLSHRNIARLLDAGHREDGQPYLAMEYIEGKAIDAYAAELSIRRKVELFLKVCAAVGYLHRNLVVHRDLKPANILVGEDGEPKLLDFGIAKMLDVTGDRTMTSMRMLTPDYASPEQVTGGPLSTATDIYSMGAVLYKLLTGSSPHQFEGDSAGAIAFGISKGTITAPSKLAPELKGDLDAILLKALRAEPQERYTTVERLAEDLENFLDSRPIRARKGDSWYRAHKFLRRYWLPVAAVTLALSGLAGGALVANHQRAIAQRRFLQVRQLSGKLFDIDIEARKFTGSTKTRQLIVDTSLDYLQRLAADAEGDPELSLELGNAYMRVARVQGVPISQNLGQMEKAEQNLRIADEFLHSALIVKPANRVAMLRSAQVAHDRMLLARLTSREDEALGYARKSAEWLEKLNAEDGDKPEAPAILVTYLNVADQYMLGRQFDDALRLCRRGSDLARLFHSQAYLGTLLWVSGEVYRRQGNLDKALQDTSESARVLEMVSKSGDQGPTMNYILALIYQGRVLGEENAISLNQSKEAAAVLQRAFAMSDAFVHQDPNDQNARGRLAMAGINLAGILRHSDPARALDIYDHILRHMGEIQNNSSFRRFEASALAGSTYALRRLGRTAEARQRLDQAFERLRQVKSYPVEKIKPGSEPDVTLSALADFEADEGNVPRAIEIYEKLLGRVMGWGADSRGNLSDAVAVSRLYGRLAVLQNRAHEPRRAAELEERRMNLWGYWEQKLPDNPFVRRQLETR